MLSPEKKRLSARTKLLAVLVFFPIPYLLVASLVCKIWHRRILVGSTTGDWFDWCMPDGMLFGFGFTGLLLIACLVSIPLLISLIFDWRSYRTFKNQNAAHD